MKVIALTPFKNEEWILPTYLSNILPVVDEIIAIDDGSTDNGPEILNKAGVHVYQNDIKVKSGWPELEIRKKLLELGRQHGGTHFVCMDADETFTGNFIKTAPVLYKKLQPGQKVMMQWLALWKSVDHYREDNSVWTNNFKDFIFCDDGKMDFPDVWMHTPRTPGKTEPEVNTFKLDPKHGAVAHFQFSDWERFQLKQAWYRCAEMVKNPNMSPASVNNKYAHSFDRGDAFVKAMPEDWKSGIVFPNISTGDYKPGWHLDKIREYFENYNLKLFEQLEIFHVKCIKDLWDEIKTQKK